MADPDLERLRQELANLDRDLLALAARRNEMASEIGRVKARSGRPTRDYAQEKEVLERGRRIAASLRLAPSLAENILRQLIAASLAQQEQDRVVDRGRGDGRRVLILGGAGRMGRWFASFLASQGFAVEIADPAGPVPGFGFVDDWRAAGLDHDIVIVAAPLRSTRDLLVELARRPPSGLVFDIGSLKSPLRDGLMALRRTGARVTSIHPMFGPSTQLLSGRHVIFVDVGDSQAVHEARGLFDATMVEQVVMDFDSHDRLIAEVLGLSHLLNIAFVATLAESGASAPDLMRISSTTFDAQLDVANRVAHENPHLYYEIQALNDYRDLAVAKLADVLARLRTMVAAGDEAAFVTLMQRGRAYLDGREQE